MTARLFALAVVLALAAPAFAGDPTTIEEVNANPSKFVGQTMTFEKVMLYGHSSGPARYRFNVKSPKGTVIKATETRPEQKLFFATRNKDEKAKKFVNGLSVEHYYTVKLTVTIRRMAGKAGKEGRYWAILKSVDSTRYRDD
jgi:hypothetical protein